MSSQIQDMLQGVDTEDFELAEWVILNVWWYSREKKKPYKSIYLEYVFSYWVTRIDVFQMICTNFYKCQGDAVLFVVIAPGCLFS